MRFNCKKKIAQAIDKAKTIAKCLNQQPCWLKRVAIAFCALIQVTCDPTLGILTNCLLWAMMEEFNDRRK
ncbi:hypothetical protein PMG71_04835 [Roseofilum sp. BLCC_M154]|uniref:Uncharacterized protein n=1 Tax=Roseofilum acuticapitatum BLCC-M154 TaxID=3022444 RepID=A0ABT7ARN9_9CYAN|nr:hypothetical protein [Roseofilum acuticapitatum]MDJ1168743.1 hypothetical protein [Roseofilum acuticapitatum BLCC-M154]